jgi:hypothetical protein
LLSPPSHPPPPPTGPSQIHACVPVSADTGTRSGSGPAIGGLMGLGHGSGPRPGAGICSYPTPGLGLPPHLIL